MLRRNVRLRREYLYRKGLEEKEKNIYDRKRKLKEALEDDKPIPTELRGDEKRLRHELENDDDNTIKPRSHMDDEYANAGVREPKILVTTSRDPSSRLTQFLKEVRLMVPNAQRVNRGSYIVKDLVDLCRTNEISDLIILHEHRGEPDGMIVSHMPYGPTAYFGLSSVVMRHDLKEKPENMSEAYPHLIFHGFNTNLGERVTNILKYLFPPPKTESKRVLTFANNNDFISFRHHTYDKQGKNVELTEVGPRFEMKLYQIQLGTLDMPEAEKEWVLRPYMNTSRKRQAL
eukprot:GILJ01004445.1.p1 GENE.GILJ01004445.1~~GILJ01004445.1.p1  ORF type:complete len:288 (+),score=43.23 GILJ01004445.1:80-943(+)